MSDPKQRIDATSPYIMLGAAGDHVLSLSRQRIAERGRKGDVGKRMLCLYGNIVSRCGNVSRKLLRSVSLSLTKAYARCPLRYGNLRLLSIQLETSAE